jgi:hypothetical protein
MPPVRTKLFSMTKTPDRPSWSPISTHTYTPSKLSIFRDAEDGEGPEIQESDEENETRRLREGSVKENHISDAAIDDAAGLMGWEKSVNERTARLLRPRPSVVT